MSYVLFKIPAIVYGFIDTDLSDSKEFDRINYIVIIIEFLTVITNPLVYTFLRPQVIKQVKQGFYKYFHQQSKYEKTVSYYKTSQT